MADQDQPLLLHHLGCPPLRSKFRGLYVAPWLLKEELKRRKPWAESPCKITLDDGYMDNHEIGLGLFRELGVTATVYLVADRIGGNNTWDALVPGSRDARLMTKGQILEWLAEGHLIGAHTLTHACLTEVSHSTAKTEIQDSRKKLQDLFQVPINSFAYPWGAYNEGLCAMVAEAGFSNAYSVGGELKVSEELKPFYLARQQLLHPKPALAALLGRFGDQVAQKYNIR